MQQDIHVLGRRLEYRWVGPARTPRDSRPALIFLHEGLGCVDLWRDFPARVADGAGLPALVYSRQGYGRSDPCTLPRSLRYMHDEGLDILPALLERAGIGPHILIGHSDGASIAIVYAGGAARAGFLGAALLAPHVFNEDVSVRSIAAAKQAYETGELKARLERWHGANVDCAFYGWNGAWLDPAFRAWNIEGYLPKIERPLMVVQGRGDEYGTLKQVDAIAAQAGAGCEPVVLDDCGHSPHRDQPDATLAALLRFIERCRATAN